MNSKQRRQLKRRAFRQGQKTRKRVPSYANASLLQEDWNPYVHRCRVTYSGKYVKIGSKPSSHAAAIEWKKGFLSP